MRGVCERDIYVMNVICICDKCDLYM
jgi:hypothetical protein